MRDIQTFRCHSAFARMTADDFPYLDAWTVAFGPLPTGPETLLLAPPRAPLPMAFALARLLVEQGKAVRLVGLGVTVPKNWPEWIRGTPARLLLSELDGYVPRERGPMLAAFTAAFERWLESVLDGVTPGSPPGQAFFSVAMERMFRDQCEAYLSARGLATLHPRGELICVDPCWSGYQMLVSLRTGADGPRSSRPGLAHLGALIAVAGAAVLRRVRDFAAETPARERLKALRIAIRGKTTPRLWLAVIGHWPLMSRPVLEMVAPLARRHGERLGILLQSSLSVGLRNTPFFDRVEQAVLPTLDCAELSGLVDAVEQGVSHDTWASLAAGLGRALGHIARAAWRAFSTPLQMRVGGATVEMSLPALPLAKLLAHDVLCAREAWEATQKLLAGSDFSGALVVWPHATNANDSVTDQLLQRCGAQTFELLHGLTELGNQLLSARTSTKTKILWSRTEAEALAPQRPTQECVGGYYPRVIPATPDRLPLRSDEPVPILIVSSYLVSAFGLDPRSFEHYQRPLLEEAALVARVDGRVRLRWRPHPGDDPRRVEALVKEFPSIERSGGSLADDLGWCRVLVTCISSVTLEALWWQVPIFVHEIPRWDATSLAVFEERRLFGFRRSLGEELLPLLTQMRAGASNLLEPEEELRRRLFGPQGQPAAMAPLFWPPVGDTTEAASPV